MPEPATVVSRILEQHFSTYERAFAIALPFAILSLWILRDALPHTFLALWAAIFLGINLVRALADRKFKRTPPAERIERVWALRATAGHGFHNEIGGFAFFGRDRWLGGRHAALGRLELVGGLDLVEQRGGALID